MKTLKRTGHWLPSIAMALAWGAFAWGADPVAAEQQYRVARRLAAERSPDAAAALRKVVELDPGGPLVDDAWVDLAAALGAAGWPEDLGALPAERRAEVEAALRLAAEVRGGDRAAEALYRAALVELEPIPGYDPAAARRRLLAVEARPDAAAWGSRARHALGWIDASAGDLDGARGAWSRVVLDYPGTDPARRALAGIARLDLRTGRPAIAAREFQGAVDADASDAASAALRELAVRNALAAAGVGRSLDPTGSREAYAVNGVRDVAGIATATDGRVWVADGRRGEVVEVDARGSVRRLGTFPDLRAIAADPRGTLFVAAGSAVYRVGSAGPTTIVDLGRSGPAGALAVDAAGTVFVAERRGERVLRVTPGSDAASTFWEATDGRIAAMVWDGVRLVVADGKNGELLAVPGSGTPVESLGTLAGARVEAMGVDPSGRIVVFDGRTRRVAVYAPDGEEIDGLVLTDAGLSRPAGCALGADGSLWTFDGQAGVLVRFP